MQHQQAISNDERLNLSRDAKSLNLVEFWAQRGDIELLAPRKRVQPYRWSWSDIEPRLRAAAHLVSIEEAERRALVFANPGLAPKPYISHTLFAAYSLYNPGETAPVHRHTPSASRFVLEGAGGYTTVGGEKITMSRGDLILTPNGQWHDHGNEGQEPVIWVDVLDVPLVESLDATIFEFDYHEPAQRDPSVLERRSRQTVREPAGHSSTLYSTGGVKPLFVSHQRGDTEHSPQFVYRWAETRKALKRMRTYPGSPFEGIIIEYVDPTTGGPVMPSMSFRSQLLRPNETTCAQRKMSSTIYCVLEGHGASEIAGQRFDWGPNDVFVVPSWAWHHHLAGRDGAILYSVTDEPAMKKLGLYRHEGETPSKPATRQNLSAVARSPASQASGSSSEPPSASAPELTSEWRTLSTPSGDIGVYVITPKEGGPRPTILMLQEIFGVNAGMRAKAERYARAGFSVAMPDLFWRQQPRIELSYGPEDRKRGFELWQAYGLEEGVEDVLAVAARLTQFPEFSPQISVVGFCLGGKIAVLAGARLRTAPVISFYGVRLDQNLDVLCTIDAPLQIHVGDDDQHVPAPTIDILRGHLAGRKNAQLIVYAGAGHGFFNSARKDVFAPEAAALAFDRTLTVLPHAS